MRHETAAFKQMFHSSIDLYVMKGIRQTLFRSPVSPQESTNSALRSAFPLHDSPLTGCFPSVPAQHGDPPTFASPDHRILDNYRIAYVSPDMI